MPLADILILSNGPGEVTTWVRPVVKTLRRAVPHARISLVLAPCSHASGKEAAIARKLFKLDRVQEPEHFFRFLLFGETHEQWDWAPFGVVLFLGGDQFFALRIGRKLGYRVVVYAEWEARWLRWVNAFAVRTEEIAAKAPKRWQSKMYVVGDLMADSVADSMLHNSPRLPEIATTPVPTPISPTEPISVQATTYPEPIEPEAPVSVIQELSPSLPWGWEPIDRQHRRAFQVGLLPGSKPAKLSLGVPLMLAVADRLRESERAMRFAIPVAPTLDVERLADYARVSENWDMAAVYGTSAELEEGSGSMQLTTPFGTPVTLWREFPAYDLLANCDICITTVGANTAELGRLGVPMVVVLPTNKLDAMRAWDGLLGLLVNIPGLGWLVVRLANWCAIRFIKFFAWPNIWAQERIVPELRGHLTPQMVADEVQHILQDRDRYRTIRDRLQEWQGEPGAAEGIAQIVREQLARAGEPNSETILH